MTRRFCGRSLLGVVLALALAWLAPATEAHDARPAYLEIRETAAGQFSLLWRIPLLGGRRLPLMLVMPDEIVDLREPFIHEVADALVERRWIVGGPGGLSGKRIAFAGLEFTTLDVVARIDLRDGTVLTATALPSKPWIDVPAAASWWQVARSFTLEGINHILFGVDHLLFVFGLLILVGRVRRLVATITAFTVAHSITLAAATLDWVNVPTPPVEACIALSIMFVAAEIIHGARGQPGVTARHPWLVAFAFGLLHGLGFADALREIGLPQNAIPAALLFFNIGVELGQLMFIAVVLAFGGCLAWAFRRLPSLHRDADVALSQLVPAYATGGLAAFWVIERYTSF
ncbi:MAG: HupE/UreJ family protein [Inquilinus sp.]|uniref:HupE/UreJ family protein n=1 Tax=Inquilinus sp. TaxID=1932117 RepID=UPI003F3D6470